METALAAAAAWILEKTFGFIRRHPYWTAALVLLAIVGPPFVQVLAWFRLFAGAGRLGAWLNARLENLLAWLAGDRSPAWWTYGLWLLPGGIILWLWIASDRWKQKQAGANLTALQNSAGPPPAALTATAPETGPGDWATTWI